MSLAEIMMLKRAAEQVATLPKGKMDGVRDRSPYDVSEDKRWKLVKIEHVCRWCKHRMGKSKPYDDIPSLCAQCEKYQRPCDSCGGPVTRNSRDRKEVPSECGECRTSGIDWGR